MSGLLATFPPEADEGPQGYFRRLAMNNGFRNWRGVLSTAGLNPSVNALWKNAQQLEEVLGLDKIWLERLLDKSCESVGLNDPFFRRAECEPVCPSCLAEGDYLRHHWSHSYVTACPRHDCVLIDACPECHASLDNSRTSISLCNCGYDLRFAVAPVASEGEVWVSARIAGTLSPSQTIDEFGELTDYQYLAKLIFQLIVRFNPSATVKPGKVPQPKTVKESVAFLQAFFSLLPDWRIRLPAHVNERLRASLDGASIATQLGPWFTNVQSLCKKPQRFKFFWQCISDAIFENFDGVLRGQNGLSPSEGVARQYVSISEAAVIMGMSVPQVQRGVDANDVSAKFFREGTSYRVTTISRREAERVRAHRDKWISESSAAKLADVSINTVKALTKAGVLEHDNEWATSFAKAGPIAASAIPELVANLCTRVTGVLTSDGLDFNELNAKRTVDIKALLMLYKAIAGGELLPVKRKPTPGLSGFVFARDEVTQFLGSVALAKSMTLLQLERATGVKYESLRMWTLLGLLPSDEVTLRGQSASVVPFESFAQFRQKYIPIADIAYALGTKASAVTARLQREGINIVGQTTPSNGARRGGLVSMRDFACFALRITALPARVYVDNFVELGHMSVSTDG